MRMASLEEYSESRLQVIASNDDLLWEILLRLPIKSLLKFKCVSKHWLSLITDPRFIRCKSLKSDAVSALLWPTSHHGSRLYDIVPIHPLQTRAAAMSLTMADPHRRLAVVKSCNGLLLCSSSSMACIDSKSKFYIYNPTTKQFRALPPRCGKSAGHGMLVGGMDLAFDPSKSNVYMVVCITSCDYSSDQCQIVVYSSETERWRVSGAPFAASRSVDLLHGVYCNGAIHWVDKSWGASLYFDMDEERVREMPMPPPPLPVEWRRGVQYFGESGGHLHIVAKCQAFMTQFNVYEMERDRSGWFLKSQVDLKGVAQSHPYMHSLLRIHSYSPVLCVVKGEKEDDSFMILHVGDKAIRYNLRARTHQVICETCSPRKLVQYHFGQPPKVITSKVSATIIPGWPYVFQYTETLSQV